LPSLAEKAAHVTMLQRSPTYIVALPAVDPLAKPLMKWLPDRIALSTLRWKNVLMSMLSFQLSRKRPHIMKAIIRKGLEKSLPADFDIDTHFKPRYNPWDQRLCLVPDGDLFKVLRDGRASVVTDTIETFTENGIKLSSGEELEADIIITATGLQMLAFGGLAMTVDGDEVKLPEKVGYKGMMLSDVPNMAAAIGYTNASWTLKCDLICEYVCRLLNHMDEIGMRQVTPRWREATLPDRPFVDLNSGYVLRSVDNFPKQGDEPPWRLYQNYIKDLMMIRRGALEDGAIEFSNPTQPRSSSPPDERLTA
jgi:cation diffusion facilitator CzcD-associated flavoprotein CzcO